MTSVELGWLSGLDASTMVAPYPGWTSESSYVQTSVIPEHIDTIFDDGLQQNATCSSFSLHHAPSNAGTLDEMYPEYLNPVQCKDAAQPTDDLLSWQMPKVRADFVVTVRQQRTVSDTRFHAGDQSLKERDGAKLSFWEDIQSFDSF